MTERPSRLELVSALVPKRFTLDILCKDLLRAKVPSASKTQQAKRLRAQWVTTSLGHAKNTCMERESAQRSTKSCVQPMVRCAFASFLVPALPA